MTVTPDSDSITGERNELRGGRHGDRAGERYRIDPRHGGRAVVVGHEHAPGAIGMHRRVHGDQYGKGPTPGLGPGYRRYASGFAKTPFCLTSKWTCGPVVTPVSPTRAMTCPFWTFWPADTKRTLVW